MTVAGPGWHRHSGTSHHSSMTIIDYSFWPYLKSTFPFGLDLRRWYVRAGFEWDLLYSISKETESHTWARSRVKKVSSFAACWAKLHSWEGLAGDLNGYAQTACCVFPCFCFTFGYNVSGTASCHLWTLFLLEDVGCRAPEIMCMRIWSFGCRLGRSPQPTDFTQMDGGQKNNSCLNFEVSEGACSSWIGKPIDESRRASRTTLFSLLCLLYQSR